MVRHAAESRCELYYRDQQEADYGDTKLQRWFKAASQTGMTGQITSDFPKSRQAQESKIFCFRSDPNQSHNFARLTADEGRFAVVTNAR